MFNQLEHREHCKKSFVFYISQLPYYYVIQLCTISLNVTSCYDDYVLREQKKLKKLDEKISVTTNGKEREKLMIKSQRMLKHLKTHSDRLKMDVQKLLIL